MIDLQKEIFPISFLQKDFKCNAERNTIRYHLAHATQGIPGEHDCYNGLLYAFLIFVIREASGERTLKGSLLKRLLNP